MFLRLQTLYDSSSFYLNYEELKRGSYSMFIYEDICFYLNYEELKRENLAKSRFFTRVFILTMRNWNPLRTISICAFLKCFYLNYEELKLLCVEASINPNACFYLNYEELKPDFWAAVNPEKFACFYLNYEELKLILRIK